MVVTCILGRIEHSLLSDEVMMNMPEKSRSVGCLCMGRVSSPHEVEGPSKALPENAPHENMHSRNLDLVLLNNPQKYYSLSECSADTLEYIRGECEISTPTHSLLSPPAGLCSAAALFYIHTVAL